MKHKRYQSIKCLKDLIISSVMNDPFLNAEDLFEDARGVWPNLTRDYFDKVFYNCMFRNETEQYL